jgi:hypothetical protein
MMHGPTSRNMQVALDFAAAGIRVFPCNVKKRPPIGFTDWLGRSTTDPTQIKQWWKKTPKALVGIPMKHIGCFTVDADRHREDEDGVAAFAELCASYDGLPEHPVVETAGNGEHHVFRQPPNGTTVPNLKWGRGLETRGYKPDNAGGYIIACGCELPDGTSYRRMDGTPSLIEAYTSGAIPHASDWLLAEILKGKEVDEPALKPEQTEPTATTTSGTVKYAKRITKYFDGALIGLAQEVAAAQPGERNKKAHDSAFRLGTLAHGDATLWSAVKAKLYAACETNGLVKDDGSTAVIASLKSGFNSGLTKPARDPEDRPRAGKATIAPVQRGGTQQAKPIITLKDGELLRILADAEAALLNDDGPPIFQRGGMLVYLHRWPTGGEQHGIRRKAGALTINQASKEWLRLRMAAAATFVRYDVRAKRELPKDPSLELANALLSATTHWKFPPLTAIIEAPTLRPDGTILDAPGYDKASALFFDPGDLTVPPLDPKPTRDDALEAFELLDDVIREFPFIDKAARSVMLAEILTALVRRSLRTAPLFAHDAPVMGSGKTLLADTSAIISTGRSIPAMSYTGEEPEDRKRITAALIAGDPMVLLDNVSKALEGDALSAVLTQDFWRDRVLGLSQVVTLPTCTTWIATGNNVTVAGDLSTRVLSCRINPDHENPEEREFARPDLRAFLLEHRGKLVHAGLTVLRAYVVAGKPKQNIKPFGRFEQWSDLIRSALMWLDCVDPCLSRQNLTIDDPVRAGLLEVLAAWKALFGNSPKTTTEVIQATMRPTGGDMFAKSENPENKALREALEAVLYRGEIKKRSLTWWLKKQQDRIVNKMAIQNAGTDRHGTSWKLKTSD